MHTTIITRERELADRAIRAGEERYRRLLASVTDYVYTVTITRGEVVGTTHGPGCEAVTGYTPEELDLDSGLWYRMVHEDDRPAVVDRAERILKGEEPPPLEHRILRKNGEIRWIRNTAVPRRDHRGLPVGYDGLVADITERKQAEEQLQHAYAELAQHEETLETTLQQLETSHKELQAAQLGLIHAAKLESVGTLAAGVAHEVKNPLQTIVMGLDYLDRNLPAGGGTLAQVLSDMRDAARRANSIVRELLHFSSTTDFQLQADDLNAVIERSLWLVNCEAVASHITVERRLAGDLPRVNMDRLKLEQVFINLFLNALQAMSHGGVLTVSTRSAAFGDDASLDRLGAGQFQRGERLVVTEVHDTGPGIAAENLAKIFDPFFTTKPVGVGTGLGLSVVKKIIDLHRGAICIQNALAGGVLATMLLRGEPEKKA
jgi:PAS domain S-box-containing protein